MKNNKTPLDFVNKYWQIFAFFTALVITWTSMNYKIEANAKEIDRLSVILNQVQQNQQKIIILEEHDKNITNDISEIKGDIKDLKNHFDIP